MASDARRRDTRQSVRPAPRSRSGIRFAEAVAGLVARHDGDIVIVTHGTVMALFIASHTGQDAFELWKQQDMPCATVLTLPDDRSPPPFNQQV